MPEQTYAAAAAAAAATAAGVGAGLKRDINGFEGEDGDEDEEFPCKYLDASTAIKAVLAAHPLDHYSRLLLPYTADRAMARSQFSRLVKQLHPDKSAPFLP
jgi:hypothetical protein